MVISRHCLGRALPGPRSALPPGDPCSHVPSSERTPLAAVDRPCSPSPPRPIALLTTRRVLLRLGTELPRSWPCLLPQRITWHLVGACEQLLNEGMSEWGRKGGRGGAGPSGRVRKGWEARPAGASGHHHPVVSHEEGGGQEELGRTPASFAPAAPSGFPNNCRKCATVSGTWTFGQVVGAGKQKDLRACH